MSSRATFFTATLAFVLVMLSMSTIVSAATCPQAQRAAQIQQQRVARTVYGPKGAPQYGTYNM
ncbi:hypothetical protein OIO90_000420 [Microbotryomycetes sp. JL221]|nr:hypothetical protein OIO90_000420 [Microbotryomycetes sp. JL221]